MSFFDFLPCFRKKSVEKKKAARKVGNLNLAMWKVQVPRAPVVRDAITPVPPYYKFNNETIFFEDIKGGATTPGTDSSRCELVMRDYSSDTIRLDQTVTVKSVVGDKITISQVFAKNHGDPRHMLTYSKSGEIVSRIKAASNNGSNVYKTLATVPLGKPFTVKHRLEGQTLRVWVEGGDVQEEKMSIKGPYKYKFGIYGDAGKSEVKPKFTKK